MGVVAEKAVTGVNQKAVNNAGSALIQLQGDDGVMGQRRFGVSIYSATGDTANVVTVRRKRSDGTIDESTTVTSSKTFESVDTATWEIECTTFSSAFLLTVRQ